ncbi:hypothetical protein [Stanieria cyanosphaera]|uniref:hypothetical protein n=1 Tax=Stanieria cyanosphaera TaxID=102116 RepID=UPI00123790EE|nr:hypothetical protein [Stanieria cyanosphaera]
MNKNTQFLALLVLLVATDLVFIVVGFFYECSRLELATFCQNFPVYHHYSIASDKSYAELFQYIKAYWMILLFGYLIIIRNKPIYLSWCFLFCYILLDDLAQLHEEIGFKISNQLNLVPALGLRAQDYGELLVSSVVGIFFLCAIGISYRLAQPQEKSVFKKLIVMLFALAVFGIVIDLVHILFDDYKWWDAIFTILEDGGEHIVMSVITCFVYLLVIKTPQLKGDDCDKRIRRSIFIN